MIEVEESARATPQPSVVPSSMTAWLFCAEHSPRQVQLGEFPDLVSCDENFVWADLSGYGEEELRAVAAVLGLDPIGVYLTLSRWQRPQLDVFRDHFFVTATVARLDPGVLRVRASELDLFVGRNWLVSAHKLPLPFADRVLTRAGHSPELVQHDSAFMLYIILDELLSYYEELSEHVEHEIEATEERALLETSERFLRDLLELKRYAFALSQLAEHHHNVFEAFLRPDFPFVTGEEVNMYFRDLEGRLARLLDALARAREAVNGAFDIYVSHVSYRTNHIMRVLTVVSTTLLPVTVVLGLFSTSIQGLPLTQPAAFVVMVAAILIICSAILMTFHRQGWI